MKRLNEELLQAAILAPQSIASATAKESAYVDVSGVPEVLFEVSTGAISSGKALTVQLLASDSADGTGAVQIAEQVFTAASDLTAAVATMSYRPTALHGRYVGVRVQQNTGAAVICCVAANLRQRMIPAENMFAGMV